MFAGQPGLLSRRYQCDSSALFRFNLPDVQLLKERVQGVIVAVVDTRDDGAGELVLSARVRIGDGVDGGDVEQRLLGEFKQTVTLGRNENQRSKQVERQDPTSEFCDCLCAGFCHATSPTLRGRRLLFLDEQLVHRSRQLREGTDLQNPVT